jgi:hypothetical protein
MGKDLIVGRAGLEGLETSLTSHLAGLDLKFDLQRLFEDDEEVAALGLLNSASVVAFLDHVAALEVILTARRRLPLFCGAPRDLGTCPGGIIPSGCHSILSMPAL